MNVPTTGIFKLLDPSVPMIFPQGLTHSLEAAMTPFDDVDGAAGPGNAGVGVELSWERVDTSTKGDIGGRVTDGVNTYAANAIRTDTHMILTKNAAGRPRIDPKARITHSATDPGWTDEADDGRIWIEP